MREVRLGPDGGVSDAKAPWPRAVRRAHAGSFDDAVISWAVSESRKLALGHGRRLVSRRLSKSAWLDGCSSKAGLGGAVTAEGFWETRAQLAAVGAVGGFAAGWALSGELAVLLGVVGGAVGWRLLPRAIERRISARAREMERHLPEMLDVVALGLRSGLSFDRSLMLYAQHFDTLLAQALMLAQRQWSSGLLRRDEALRRVSSTYDSALFARVVESIIRSLRFGSSLADGLEAASREARLGYRARKQEQIAKAPVRMMVPTGALILPAMLILVLGPVLLELAGGF